MRCDAEVGGELLANDYNIHYSTSNFSSVQFSLFHLILSAKICQLQLTSLPQNLTKSKNPLDYREI